MQAQEASTHSVRKTRSHETEAYVGILIYMGLVDLPEIDYYFFFRFLFMFFTQASNDSGMVSEAQTIFTSQSWKKIDPNHKTKM